MIAPDDYHLELERLAELEALDILDTPAEEAFDDITKVAASVCKTPIALISLVDDKRQWFKSNHGLDIRETKKEYSFCAHAIQNPDHPMVITDARKDARFKDNPLVHDVPNVVFYAGVPLVTDKGLPIGSLCVIDHEARSLTDEQLDLLSTLSKQAVHLIYYRKLKGSLKSGQSANVEHIKEINERVQNSYQVVASMLMLQSSFMDNDRVKSILRYLKFRIKAQVIIHELLYNSKNLRRINFGNYLEHLVNYLILNIRGEKNKIMVNYQVPEVELNMNTVIPVGLIVNEIVSNVLNYGVEEDAPGSIRIELEKEGAKEYRLNIKDDGNGFSSATLESDSFLQGQEIIRNLVEGLDGKVVTGDFGKGTDYSISFSEMKE